MFWCHFKVGGYGMKGRDVMKRIIEEPWNNVMLLFDGCLCVFIQEWVSLSFELTWLVPVLTTVSTIKSIYKKFIFFCKLHHGQQHLNWFISILQTLKSSKWCTKFISFLAKGNISWSGSPVLFFFIFSLQKVQCKLRMTVTENDWKIFHCCLIWSWGKEDKCCLT